MTAPTYLIRPAMPDDLQAVLALRSEAEQWLAEVGIVQWTPDYGQYAVGVLTDWVRSGAAWVVDDGCRVVATVSAMNVPDLDFWGWADPVDRLDAVYLGKMIVARSHAGLGLGDAILNWASLRAASAQVQWLRIDVRRDNLKLQGYYLSRGFAHVRTWHAPGRRTESGWMAQRPAGTVTPTPSEVHEEDDFNSAAAACRSTLTRNGG